MFNQIENINHNETQVPLSPLSVAALLQHIEKQVAAYRNEDAGDESLWSMYNQGRADALIRLEGDIRRIIGNNQDKQQP